MVSIRFTTRDRQPTVDAGPGPPGKPESNLTRRRESAVNKLGDSPVEIRPATLQFRHGKAPGIIYALRVGGQIVEAYRGYGYDGYTPNAPALRSDPMPLAKQ